MQNFVFTVLFGHYLDPMNHHINNFLEQSWMCTFKCMIDWTLKHIDHGQYGSSHNLRSILRHLFLCQNYPGRSVTDTSGRAILNFLACLKLGRVGHNVPHCPNGRGSNIGPEWSWCQDQVLVPPGTSSLGQTPNSWQNSQVMGTGPIPNNNKLVALVRTKEGGRVAVMWMCGACLSVKCCADTRWEHASWRMCEFSTKKHKTCTSAPAKRLLDQVGNTDRWNIFLAVTRDKNIVCSLS